MFICSVMTYSKMQMGQACIMVSNGNGIIE